MLDKKLKRYFGYTIFTLIFGLVYEIFSFGVYSKYMVFAFLYPLLGLIINLILKKINIDEFSITLFDMSILTFTIGSILHGILDIYGTTNILLNYFKYIAFILLLFSIVTNLIEFIFNKNKLS